jgi:hypothetical protein
LHSTAESDVHSRHVSHTDESWRWYLRRPSPLETIAPQRRRRPVSSGRSRDGRHGFPFLFLSPTTQFNSTNINILSNHLKPTTITITTTTWPAMDSSLVTKHRNTQEVRWMNDSLVCAVAVVLRMRTRPSSSDSNCRSTRAPVKKVEEEMAEESEIRVKMIVAWLCRKSMATAMSRWWSRLTMRTVTWTVTGKRSSCLSTCKHASVPMRSIHGISAWLCSIWLAIVRSRLMCYFALLDF